MTRVLVLGAGPCGLLTAAEVCRAGHEVTVVEAAPAVGGMSGSFVVAGQRVDFGSHRLHPATDAATLALLSKLLGDDLQWRDRNGRIRIRDRWVAFPLRSGDMIRHLPPAFTARAAGDAITAPRRRAQSAMSFADEITRRLGRAVADDFYRPYARKLYGCEPEELSVELAHRRVAAGSPVDIIRRAVARGASPSRQFLYPRQGYGQISEALAELVTERGGAIRCSARAEQIDLAGGKVVTSDGAVESADLIVSTIPLPVLLDALGPAAPTSIADDVATLRTRGMVLVYLALDRSRYTPFDAHYFPGADLTVARVSEPKNYRTSADDPAAGTVLCAEIACWPGDELWSASDDELAGIVVDDLARAGLPGLPAVRSIGVETRRLPAVYPVYERSTEGARRRVEQWLADPPAGLLSTGRQGLGVPDNLHHVLAMARGTAAAIGSVGGSVGVDGAAWRARLDEYATHVVLD